MRLKGIEVKGQPPDVGSSPLSTTTTTLPTITTSPSIYSNITAKSNIFVMVENDVNEFYVNVNSIDLVFIVVIIVVFLMIVALVCK